MRALIVFQFIFCMTTAFEIQRHFVFKDALSASQSGMRRDRSEASYNQTVFFAQDRLVKIKLCIEPMDTQENVIIIVSNILYSNDGGPDNIKVTLNNVDVGTFSTVTKYDGGHAWNVFRDSGEIGAGQSLPKGTFLLKINADVDQYGVELDNIRINAENQKETETLFCGPNTVS